MTTVHMEMESICLFFYQSTEVFFLFDQWHVKKLGPYIACLIASYLFGFLLEMITFCIQQLKNRLKTETEVSDLINGSKPITDGDASDNSFVKRSNGAHQRRIKWDVRIYIALAFMVQLFLAYLVMLIVMTYNVLLFLAPVFGMITGYMVILFLEPAMHHNYSPLETTQPKHH